MTADKKTFRRPWLAALLQLALPGLGYLYCGRPTRAVVLYLTALSAPIAGLEALARFPGPLTLLIVVVGILALVAFLIVDAVRCAKAANPGYVLATYNRWYIYVVVALALPIIPQTLLPRVREAHLARAYVMPSPSMEPTLLLGDEFVADKSAYQSSEPERRDIAVYPSTDYERTYIHRIVGLPGETIEVRGRKVFINGQELDESYAHFSSPNSEDLVEPLPPTVLPADTYFLMGDNRDNSLDSRFIGPVHRSRLHRKVRMVLYSHDLETGEIRWGRTGKVIE